MYSTTTIGSIQWPDEVLLAAEPPLVDSLCCLHRSKDRSRAQCKRGDEIGTLMNADTKDGADRIRRVSLEGVCLVLSSENENQKKRHKPSHTHRCMAAVPLTTCMQATLSLGKKRTTSSTLLLCGCRSLPKPTDQDITKYEEVEERNAEARSRFACVVALWCCAEHKMLLYTDLRLGTFLEMKSRGQYRSSYRFVHISLFHERS